MYAYYSLVGLSIINNPVYITQVLVSDIPAGASLVHVINKVLVPQLA